MVLDLVDFIEQLSVHHTLGLKVGINFTHIHTNKTAIN